MLLSRRQVVLVRTLRVGKPHRSYCEWYGENVKRLLIRFGLVAVVIEIVLSIILVLLGVQYAGYQ
jgi:hypothetical protein